LCARAALALALGVMASAHAHGDSSDRAKPMKIYIFADLEGISGMPSREFVRSDGRYFEKGRLCYAWDINACIEGCFKAGADGVIVRDGHGSGKTAILSELDPRAEVIQGQTPVRMLRIEECDAVILLGYHAMAGTPEAFSSHTYSSKTVRNMWMNGRLAGEIGIDAGIVSDYGLPIIMVSGDDKACREAEEWIPGVVTCRVKDGLSWETARTLPLDEAHKLIEAKTIEAIGKIGSIRPIEVARPVTIRKQMIGQIRVPDPSVRPDIRLIDQSTAEATAGTVEKAFLWR